VCNENLSVIEQICRKNGIDDDSMSYFTAGKTDWDEVYDLVLTPSFFGERLIVIRDGDITALSEDDFSKLEKNEEQHYLKCSKCGEVNTDSYKYHLYDSACDSDCNYCSNSREVSHKYDKFNSDCLSHWYECSSCGEVDFYSKKPHSYDNACDTTCNDCEYIRDIVHDYSTAKKDGDKYYKECNICGEIIETKTPELIIEEGCSGSIGSSIFGVILLLTTISVIKQRKKEEY
jgi:uncharacterized Zn finger protein